MVINVRKSILAFITLLIRMLGLSYEIMNKIFLPFNSEYSNIQ